MEQKQNNLTKTKYGQVKNVKLTSEMKHSYLDYAMSVIVARALPDVRDGLKPVHRRLLYAMHKMGLHYPARYTKSAKIVGETMGKYHPHGDGPIYGALVRLAQDFSLRYPIVDGQGNFGSLDGDPPAAMRYTEARLAKIADELLCDIEKETVDFAGNFDDTLQEPAYLPAKLPNLLLAGSDGIAVGMATKIPPHNLTEVVDALIYIIENSTVSYAGHAPEQFTSPEDGLEKEKDPFVEQKFLDVLKKDISLKDEISSDDLLKIIKGPDFPTGGIIFDKQEIKQAYTTGKASIVVRAKADIQEVSKGKNAIIVTEIPYQVNKSNLIANIARYVQDKKITDIADLRDESDRDGVRIYIELKKSAVAKKALNKLYKLSELQTSYPINLVALIGKTPHTLTLKRILDEFLKHRHNIIKRRSIFELRAAKKRAHILEGLKIAVNNIDEIIAIIRRAKDVDKAREKLMARFKLSQMQAQAILDMQLKRLSALERQKIEDEYKLLEETIAYLEDLLLNPKKIFKVVKEELEYLKEKYGDKRRTKVIAGKIGSFSEEDLTPNEDTIITITQDGYIKRVPIGTYRVQRRGGKGVSGMKTKEDDSIEKIFSCQTHDWILFFTNLGRVFQTRVWELPESSRHSKGKAVVNLIATQPNEEVTSILTYSAKNTNKEKSFIFMATKKGTVKKTPLSDFKNIRSSGLIAIKLTDKDKLRWVKMTNGKNHILLVTKNGISIRFSEKDVRSLSRPTMGVRGINLKKNDEVLALQVFSEELIEPEDKRRKAYCDILTIAEKGIGKRTPVAKFTLQKRGGVGIKAANINAKTGKLSCVLIVDQNSHQVVITSRKGLVIKLPVRNIPQLGRNTQGVILMRFARHKPAPGPAKESDKIASATVLEK